jgi:ATP-dependent RNA helicase RhlE
MSASTFTELGASPRVTSALSARDIHSPFPVQRMVVPEALSGHDALVESPTGSGKTLAFGIPIVERLQPNDRRTAALVLVPTRELAGQVTADLRDLASARSLSVTAAYGGVGIAPQVKAARHAHILVATPGRLEDLVDRGAVSLEHVRILVVDEADRMLDMGFRPAVDRIVELLPRRRQTLLFSATLDGAVTGVAEAYTRDARSHRHTPVEERSARVEHRFVAVTPASKLDALVRELRPERHGLSLVFVRTKRGADRLVKRLTAHDVRAVAMHGNKSQPQREKALARFEAGKVDALVATDVAARGLDVDRIARVINFDAPADRDGYVHRVGRTGRAGRDGLGITFVVADQAGEVHRIAKALSLDAEFERSGLGTRTASANGGSRRRRRSHRANGNRAPQRAGRHRS